MERPKGKIVQINPVLRMSTSTGRIMQEIGKLVEENGWQNWCAYSLGRDGIRECTTDVIPVGNRVSTALHGLATRLFDRHGLASKHATREFVSRLREISPDIVHIHNIHGYFLHYPTLFRYLAESGVKVVWTVHDCWLYTGHCYHYSFAGCDRWKTGCGSCPQRGEFPRSIFIDRSARNFADKKAAFTSIPRENFVIVPVSEWIRGEMSHSILKDYKFRVIHNGIDTSVFRPYDDSADIRARVGVAPGQKIILGLASIWSREKGLDDFIRMSAMTRPDETIVLVGVDDETARRLPESIRWIRRTENIGDLARLYSAATAFVNPTWQDNYPTVNLEAISSGTPVVTYRTGGSVEAITPQTGRIVEQGDVGGLLKAVREIDAAGRDSFTSPCREYALQNFRREDRYREYLSLYQQILTGNQ